MNNEYIILDNDKAPSHSFKGGGLPWNMVEDCNNIAVIVPDPYIVLDFDTKTDAEIMMKIVESLDLHCKVMQTDRGFHFWFKSSEPLKNFVKQRLAIGIYCDRKVCNRNAYVIIRKNGKDREWLRNYEDNDVAFLPKWLTAVSAPDTFDFIGLKSGDGRNQKLFNYILFLQERGFKRDDVITTLEVINKFVFAEPVSNRELQTVCREEAFKTEEEIQEKQAIKEETSDKFKFHHEQFANLLRDQYGFISVNDAFYTYKDGYYQKNQKDAEKILIELYPSIKESQRNEVMNYLKLCADKTKEVNLSKKDPYTINLLNGRLNLKTGVLTEHSADYYDFERIPVNYDPNANHELLDTVLSNIFCDDKQVIDLFDEIVADCLLKENIFQTAFIFYGGGSNGKSTLFEVIRSFLGKDNVSAIELDKLGQRFQAESLLNKLANIGDDLNFTAIRDNGTIKKLFSGDAVQVERKYGDPFMMVSYATQIFACNEIPHTADKSNGMMRRLCFVPCLATFGSDGFKKDPLIRYKITTQEALSHLLNRAMGGLKRLLKNGYFTVPDVVETAKKAYMKDNSNVLTWIDEAEITEDIALSKPAGDLYIAFTDWCRISNVREIVGKKGFNKEVSREFDFSDRLQQRRIDGVRHRFFIKKL